VTTQEYSPKKHFQKFFTQLCSNSFMSDKRFGVKEFYSSNSKTNNKSHRITLTIGKKIQKSSTLLHSTSQHTKKAKTFPSCNKKTKNQKPQKKKKKPIKIHKQNPYRILENIAPKTNQLLVYNALNFNLIRKHVLLPTFLLFFPLPFVATTATTQ